MGYYSIVATARQAVGVRGYLIAFDKGLNVVTVTTNDLEALVRDLRANGITVISVQRLDQFEDVSDLDLRSVDQLSVG